MVGVVRPVVPAAVVLVVVLVAAVAPMAAAMPAASAPAAHDLAVALAQDDLEPLTEPPFPDAPDDALDDSYWGRCAAASRHAFALVPELLQVGANDSLFAVLTDWADVCGVGEPIFRTVILATIWEGSFSEDLYDETVLDHLLWYEEKNRRIHVETWANPGSPFHEVASAVDDLAALAAYDSFTADVAYQLEPHLEHGSLEEAFALQYQTGNEDLLMRRLSAGFYADTWLQAYYDAEVRRLRTAAAWDWGVYVSYWDPGPGLRPLGAHGGLGARAGLHRDGVGLRLDLGLRLGPAGSRYRVNRGGALLDTDDYLALHVSLEPEIRLFRSGRAELGAFLRLGWEGFEYESQLEGAWLHSLRMEGGLGARVDLDRDHGSFLHADLGYAVYDFATGYGGTELQGHAWTLRVGFGTAIDATARRRLARLQAGFAD
ncbi:MAG: hypothetical protein R6X25_15820 [Candidatus Krumholzibacteriia bacterium]